jgi:hypothetical protein
LWENYDAGTLLTQDRKVLMLKAPLLCCGVKVLDSFLLVKNVWNYTSTPPCLHGVIIKHRNNFTFTFSLIYHSGDTVWET